MTTRHTDEFAPRFEPPSPAEPEPITRFIDIHVYEQPAEPPDPPYVESQPDNQEPAGPIESQPQPPEPARTQRHVRYTIPLVALACLALIGITMAALLSPLLTGPSATVTI